VTVTVTAATICTVASHYTSLIDDIVTVLVTCSVMYHIQLGNGPH